MRLPGKSMKPLDNMPLVYYSIHEALQVDLIDKVYVLTDSDKIGKFALKIGATYIIDWYARKNPKGRGGWDMIGFIIYNLNLQNDDILIFWHPTNPFIEASDIKTMLSMYVSYTCDSIIATAPVKEHPAWMLKEEFNFAEPYKGIIYLAQDNPQLIIPKGCWMASVANLKKNKGFYGKKIKPYHLPPEKALDIDDLADFEYAELLMYKKKRRRK